MQQPLPMDGTGRCTHHTLHRGEGEGHLLAPRRSFRHPAGSRKRPDDMPLLSRRPAARPFSSKEEPFYAYQFPQKK